MESSNAYDIVVLGGGSGGYACAFRAAELGQRVALIEKDKVGGTCLHRGCIPTKALLHAAEIADQARESENFGVKTQFEGIDMPGVHAYKDRVVTRLWKGLQGLVRSHGIDFVTGRGTARLADPGPGRRHRLRGGARRARDGFAGEEPAWPRTRRRTRDHQRRGAHAGPGTPVGGHSGRRRHRRGVRKRVAVVRGRGDDRRDAASPRAQPRRSRVRAPRAGVQAARHLLRARREVRERQEFRQRCHGLA